MMMVLATLSTEFIYTPFQTNITNCYSTETLMLYNRNINRIIIQLISLNNTDCDQFPGGIEAQLQFKTAGIPIQRIRVQNFSYNETQEFVFEDVPAIASETFVVLNIYSYKFITELSIFIMREQKSSLDECFMEDSKVVITQTKMAVNITSTKMCSNQFKTIYNSTAPTEILSRIQTAELNIQGQLFNLDVEVLEAEYELGDTISYVLEITSAQAQNLMTMVAPNATITFQAKQGSVDVEFFHDIGSVQTVGFYVDDIIVWNTTQPPQIGLFQSRYSLRINFNSEIDRLSDQFEALNFDNIVYRITGLAPGVVYTQQLTIQTTVFDPTMRFIAFYCDQGREEDRKDCRDFFLIADSYEIDSTYYLEIIFQLGTSFVHIEQRRIQMQSKDLQYIVIGIRKNQGYAQIVSTIYIPVSANAVANMRFTVIQNSNPVSFDDSSVSFTFSGTIKSYSDQVYFDCDDVCNKLIQTVQNDPQASFQIEANFIEGLVFGDFVIDIDYVVMKALVIAIGCAVICSLVVMSIISIVQMMKQVKQQHKKRRG